MLLIRVGYTRIKQKKDVTRLLDDVTVNEISRDEFIKCIEKVEAFIIRLEYILLKDTGDTILINELNNLMGIHNARRTTQNFYSLWLILNKIEMSELENNALAVKKDIRIILSKMKNCIDKDIDWLGNHNKSIVDFHSKYLAVEEKA